MKFDIANCISFNIFCRKTIEKYYNKIDLNMLKLCSLWLGHLSVEIKINFNFHRFNFSKLKIEENFYNENPTLQFLVY